MFDLWFVCVAVANPAAVFLLCVVAIPATVLLLCWCGPCRSGSRKTSGQKWSAMVFKRGEGVRRSWGKNEQKESWRERSRLMDERSGRVNSVLSQMCGRGGAAGGATMTSQRGCVGSRGRRLSQRMENVWTLRMRSRVARSWMSKGGSCRRSCEMKKVLLCAERASGKPQEEPATAAARGKAKESRPHV